MPKKLISSPEPEPWKAQTHISIYYYVRVLNLKMFPSEILRSEDHSQAYYMLSQILLLHYYSK